MIFNIVKEVIDGVDYEHSHINTIPISKSILAVQSPDNLPVYPDTGIIDSAQNSYKLIVDKLKDNTRIVEFLDEVTEAMQEKGTNFPIDLIAGWFLLQYVAEGYETSGLYRVPTKNGFPLIPEPQVALQKLEEIIESNYRDTFKNLLSILVPQASPGWQDRYYLKGMYSQAGLQEPRSILDLGCGVGRSASEWKEFFPNASYFGIDRQYIPQFFDVFWRTDNHFLVGDIRKLPMRAGEIDLCVAEFVMQYLTPQSLESTLSEILRILREEGVLAITPHYGDWALYQKINGTLIAL